MRWLICLVAAFLVGCALIVQQPGCSEAGQYALVRALGDGTATVDRYHWSTCDVSWYRQHFYVAKGPGLALASFPAYAALRSVGLVWNEVPPADGSVRGGVPGKAVWPFTLLMVVSAAAGLLLLMRAVAGRIAPGTGTVTAVALALGTMLLPYATLYTAHVPAAMLGFAAFAVLFAERQGSASFGRLAAAGALAGFSLVVDLPMGLVTVLLACYAAARGPVLARAAAYAAGALAGVAPLMAFNQWAFGSVTHESYAGAVLNAGQTGHDQLGLNSAGFFGIAVPSLNVAARLLLVNRGLLVATPVVAAALAGLVLLYRRRWRAEAVTIALLVAAYLTYNAAYSPPFGGDSAGPRFLIPLLPFLALPLALAFARLPVTTSLLAAISVGMMATATLTQPMLEADDTQTWFSRAAHGAFADTLLTRAGVANHTLAALPAAAALLAVVALAVKATGRLPVSRVDVRAAVAATVVWAVLGSSAPGILSSGLPTAASTLLALALLAAGVAAVALAIRMPLRSSAPS
jgi:hypothetical protein